MLTLEKQLEGFGKNLKRIREERGITTTFLALNCGIKKSSVSNMEHSHIFPRVEVLLKICAELKCTPNDLFGF